MISVMRNVSSLLRGSRTLLSASRRCLTTKQPTSVSSTLRPLVTGAALLGGGYVTYQWMKEERLILPTTASIIQQVHAAALTPPSQPSVYSPTKKHALYLWIHLKPTADAKACAKVVANLQQHVDVVSPKDLRDESDEILAGVGFGPKFFSRISGKTRKDYTYPHRKGPLGELPSSGGDIFIHAKSDDYSKLFELCQKMVSQMPAGSIDKYEDIYSFVYRNGRDLSGFIDGTENPADEDDRRSVAVEKETGGSYVVTQKWIHDLNLISSKNETELESWVGRDREDSIELKKKSITSHVARMTGGNNFGQKKRFQIVRQSMPYGNLHDKAGLFFIGYASSPENLEYMLARMVGEGSDGQSDDVMKFTRCETGTYWYFPGLAELKRLA